jgi:hypothetical protein
MLTETRPMPSDLKVAELCGKESYMISPKTPFAIDLDRAAQIIEKAFKLKIRTSYGLIFDYSDDVAISLMKTGNMLIKGAGDEKEALLVCDKVMKTLK